MFIIQLTYKTSLTEVDKYLQAHREFLDYYYKQGLLIASGPMKPRVGGIIIAASNNKEYLESVFKKDPYYLAEIADYEFLEFSPVMYCESLKPFIEEAESILC
ncbi:YciI family protein [Legionella gresilensis]|uniref:YciI family protein n=1 Tax=Legionella gresilensis TaxID=91823 RepID=UPI00104142AB|nr:YciI family protein [Legionella gresilensis]